MEHLTAQDLLLVFVVFFVVDAIWKIVKDSTVRDLKRRVEELEQRQ